MINETQLNRLIAKFDYIANEYKEYRISEKKELICEYVITDENYTSLPMDLAYKTATKGDKISTEFGYAWFKTVVNEDPNDDLFLYAETGGVESLVLINGKPYGMLDYVGGAKEPMFRLHKYVRLPKTKSYELVIESYLSHAFYGTMPYEKKQTFALAGYQPERVYNGIYICKINKVVDSFVDNLVFFQSLYRAQKHDEFYKSLLKNDYERLFASIDALPTNGICEAKLMECNRIFDEILVSDNRKSSEFVGLLGHSHLDTAWLWKISETRKKAARTASNAVTMLDRYPDYKFMMSSLLYFDWFRKDYPSLFSDIQRLCKVGRFEINGGAFVECDCNLVSGESLVRQFLKGQLFSAKYFGRYSDCFYLPDTFGYSASLPQIMKGCGMEYFMTTKLSWNDTNKFPYDNFIWQGIDGSQVVSSFNMIHLFPNAESINGRGDAILNKHTNQSTLLSYGYGDGGGGPDEKMIQSAIQCKNKKGIYKNTHITVSEFFKKLKVDRLPKYCGELYLELHRGTFTTNHMLKKLNRKLEQELLMLEYLLSIYGFSNVEKAKIDMWYEVMLINQFHDILPGTCIKEVNLIAIEENTQALSEVMTFADNLLGEQIAVKNDKISVLNPLSFQCDYTLELSVGLEGVPRQLSKTIDGDNVVLNFVSIDQHECKTYDKASCIVEKSSFIYTGNTLKTPLYIVKFDSDMSISSFVYNGREIANGNLNRFRYYDDVPYLWDNWDIDADYKLKDTKSISLISSIVVSDGAYCFVLQNEYSLVGGSTISQQMRFYSNKLSIDFITKINNQSTHKLLKVDFDTALISPTYKSEIQFGNVTRLPYQNNCFDQAKYEVLNHRYTDMSETSFGVAILNDCKYGISVLEGSMSLTLLKSGTHPDSSADIGVSYCNYSMLLHDCGFNAKAVVKPAYAFNYRPYIIEGELEYKPLLSINSSSVILETVKPAEDLSGIILRLYESEGSGVSAVIQFMDKYVVEETDMLEKTAKKIGAKKEIRLDFLPFEIKTIKVYKE